MLTKYFFLLLFAKNLALLTGKLYEMNLIQYTKGSCVYKEHWIQKINQTTSIIFQTSISVLFISVISPLVFISIPVSVEYKLVSFYFILLDWLCDHLNWILFNKEQNLSLLLSLSSL